MNRDALYDQLTDVFDAFDCAVATDEELVAIIVLMRPMVNRAQLAQLATTPRQRRLRAVVDPR